MKGGEIPFKGRNTRATVTVCRAFIGVVNDRAVKDTQFSIVSPNERREARASLVDCTGVVSMIEETTI